MTYTDLFPALPGDAHCWFYIAERSLTEKEQAALLARLQTFFGGWTSHGRPVVGAATVLEGRFLLVAGTVLQGDLSGCGIDASVHEVEALAVHLGVAWTSPLQVFYRDAAGAVQGVPRSAFRRLVQAGEVTAETPVFDVSLARLDQVREGAFEKPAGRSWHARVFRIPQHIL